MIARFGARPLSVAGAADGRIPCYAVTGSRPAPAQSGARLAELLAALSLVTDLARGHPAEQAMRACLLALGLAERAGLERADLADVYYAALLRYIGCTATSPDYAADFGGDDVEFRRLGDLVDAASSEGLGFLWRLNRGRGPSRPIATARMARRAGGLRTIVAGDCEVAARLSARFGFASPLQAALDHGFERWDGKGAPRGLAGEQIATPARVAAVAFAAVMFEGVGGADTARDAVRRWRGRILDPHLADVFLSASTELLATATPDDAWDAVVEAEPQPHRTASDDRLDAVADGFAAVADLKSTFLYGHSTGVARLAESAARLSGAAGPEIREIRLAGLFHDLGRAGVATGVWDKPGNLSRSEWEQVRLHPYHTERILAAAPTLARVARVAAGHHERCDGSGYHRAVAGVALDRGARLLAAADVFHALTEARPHRPGVGRDQAARTVEESAARGELDREASRAVIEAAGERARIRLSHPAGLSDREVEVLRILARGQSERAIATQLFLSPATVHSHVRHIYDKVGVSTRAAVAVFAMENDLLGISA